MFKSLFLDRQDNLDLAAVLGVIAFAAFIFYSFHAYIIHGQTFDPVSFGTGSGGLVTGIGAHKLLSNKGDYGS